MRRFCRPARGITTAVALTLIATPTVAAITLGGFIPVGDRQVSGVAHQRFIDPPWSSSEAVSATLTASYTPARVAPVPPTQAALSRPLVERQGRGRISNPPASTVASVTSSPPVQATPTPPLVVAPAAPVNAAVATTAAASVAIRGETPPARPVANAAAGITAKAPSAPPTFFSRPVSTHSTRSTHSMHSAVVWRPAPVVRASLSSHLAAAPNHHVLVAIPATTARVPVRLIPLPEPAPAPDPGGLSTSPTITFANLAQPWACIAWVESKDTANINTGNGAYGAFQFQPPTWNFAAVAAGHPEWANGRADLWPLTDQYAAALAISHSSYGLSPWRGDSCVG